MMLMLTLEKSEEAYLIDLDERWFHDIKPLLTNGTGETKEKLSTSTASTSTADSNANNNKVAGEIKLLSTQIKALQETMEDLYETVFTSSLNDKNNKKWMYKKVSSYS